MQTGKRLRLAAWSAAGIAMMAGGPVDAATSTGTLTVQVQVQSACTISDGTLDFGTYQSGQSDPLVAHTTLQITDCNAGSVTVEIDGGGTGDTRARRLTGPGGATLAYQLYKGSSLGNVFGTGSSARVIDMTGITTKNVPVYGRIAGGQTAAPGTYTDTLNVTLTF